MKPGETQTRHKALKVRSSNRDGTQFIAMPACVLQSDAFMTLSHPARSLLWEIALQFVRDNNGRLLASMAHLAKRGWNSADVITRAKRELMEAGFIFETVKGHRPNKASWYAVTWRPIDRNSAYDHGAFESFERSAYLKPAGRDRSSASLGGVCQNASLRPSRGAENLSIAPSHGVGGARSTPSRGAIRVISGHPSAPSDGNHLEMPSAAAPASAFRHVEEEVL